MDKMQLRSEQLIINSILLSPSIIHDIMSVISDDMFVTAECKLIFTAIKTLYISGEPINLITTYKEIGKAKSLNKNNALHDLTKIHSMFSYGDRNDLDSAISLLTCESIRNEHIDLGSDIIKMSQAIDYDPKNVLNTLQNHILDNKFKSIINKKNYSNDDLLTELDAKMISASSNEGINGIKMGYNRIDTITSGMQPTNFIIVAARPAMGKTQFALGILRNASINDDKKGLFISCEMDEVQVMKRIMSVDSKVKGYSIKRGKLDINESRMYERSRKRISKAEFKIVAGAFTLADVLSLVYKTKLSQGLDYVIIDYIQKITVPGSQNRTNEVGEVSRKLKDMANDLKIPVIALAQLSRSVEHRTDRKPILSDLRESGDIEQDADIVMFLYRPNYYMSQEERDVSPTIEDGYVIVAKHRDGELEDILLKFNPQIPSWLNQNEESDEQTYTQSALTANNDFDYQNSQPF